LIYAKLLFVSVSVIYIHMHLDFTADEASEFLIWTP